MDAMSPRQLAHQVQSRSRSYVIIRVIFMGIVIMLLPSSSSAKSAMHGMARGSIKAELFHREHPYSRMQPESKPLGHLERLHSEGKRSAARAEALQRRLTAGQTHDNTVLPSQDGITWDTTITNGAPAEYLMTISLGTPPQKFVAVADTGSDLTWLQCAPCVSCFNQSAPVFDPSLSSSYQKLSCSSNGCKAFLLQYGSSLVTSCQPSCNYSYYYGDNSNTTGTFSAETINLCSSSGQNVKVPDFWFGCSQSSFSPSALYDSADGLVGLGQGLISFPSQLGHVFEDKFSYCLVNRSLAAVQSSILVFGHDAAMEHALQYTPILSNPPFPYYYYIGVEGISVGCVPVNYSRHALALDKYGNGGIIIDSGTTFSYLDTRAYTPLLVAIDSKVPEIYERVTLSADLSFLELCYNVTGLPDYGSHFPDLSFKMANNTSWNLSLDNSWILLSGSPDDDSSMIVCLAIIRGYEGAISILGNTQQQDFRVLYDRVDQRIGFAPADCADLCA